MPSDPTTSPEQHRMITFDASPPMAPANGCGSRHKTRRMRAADRRREAGHSMYWLAWADGLQAWVSIPED